MSSFSSSDEDDDQELEFASADEGDSDDFNSDSDENDDKNENKNKNEEILDENVNNSIVESGKCLNIESNKNENILVTDSLKIVDKSESDNESENNEFKDVIENKNENLDELSDLSDLEDDKNNDQNVDSELSDYEKKIEDKKDIEIKSVVKEDQIYNNDLNKSSDSDQQIKENIKQEEIIEKKDDLNTLEIVKDSLLIVNNDVLSDSIDKCVKSLENLSEEVIETTTKSDENIIDDKNKNDCFVEDNLKDNFNESNDEINKITELEVNIPESVGKNTEINQWNVDDNLSDILDNDNEIDNTQEKQSELVENSIKSDENIIEDKNKNQLNVDDNLSDTSNDDENNQIDKINTATVSKNMEINQWNVDDDLSDILDDDNEIENNTQEKIKKEEDKNVNSENIEMTIEKDDIIIVKEKNDSNIVTSGWDDTEFSDIDDNDESTSEVEIIKKDFINNDDKFKINEETIVGRDLENKNKQQQQQQQQQGGWSWYKFGSSIINTATNITSQFVETVESTLGAPDPLELAKKSKLEREKLESEISEKNEKDKSENERKDDFNDNWDDQGDWFSAIPINKITSTGKQLVSGSLDVLESVGKKTIEVISDKDPNLKQTRQFIKKATTVAGPTKPNLSQLLREAQEESIKNESNKSMIVNKNQSTLSATNSSFNQNKVFKEEKMNFSSCFDDYKGQVHLEALEMLSRQSTVKYEMQMLSLNEKRVNSIIEPLKQLFNVDEIINDDNDNIDSTKEFNLNDFEDLFIDYMSELNVKLSIDKVIQSFKTASFSSKELTSNSEVYNEAIKCFALITATMVEFYHKIAESLIIQQQNNTNKKPNYMVIQKAENLNLITKLCVKSVVTIANDFCRNFKTLNQDKSTSINQKLTNILLEASNGNTYISDSFILLFSIFKCLIIDETSL